MIAVCREHEIVYIDTSAYTLQAPAACLMRQRCAAPTKACTRSVARTRLCQTPQSHLGRRPQGGRDRVVRAGAQHRDARGPQPRARALLRLARLGQPLQARPIHQARATPETPQTGAGGACLGAPPRNCAATRAQRLQSPHASSRRLAQLLRSVRHTTRTATTRGPITAWRSAPAPLTSRHPCGATGPGRPLRPSSSLGRSTQRWRASPASSPSTAATTITTSAASTPAWTRRSTATPSPSTATSGSGTGRATGTTATTASWTSSCWPSSSRRRRPRPGATSPCALLGPADFKRLRALLTVSTTGFDHNASPAGGPITARGSPAPRRPGRAPSRGSSRGGRRRAASSR